MLHAQPIRRFVYTVFWTVVAAAACIGLGFAGKPVILATLALVAGLITVTLVRDLERVSLILLAALVPIRVTMHLTEAMVYDRAHSASGFVISVFDCLVIVLVLAWLRRIVLYNQPIRWLPRYTVPAALLLPLVVYAGSRAVVDQVSAWWMILRYLESYLLFLYLVNNIRPVRDYYLHSMAVCGCLVFEGMVGFAQELTGSNVGMEIFGAPKKRSTEVKGTETMSRMVGTLATPNAFAAMLSLFIAHPAGLMFANLRRHKLLIFGALMLTGLTILGTKSRGVWLSSGLVFGYALYRLLRMRLRTSRTLLAFGWMMFFVIIILVATPGVMHRLITDDQGSTDARVYMNQIAFNLIQDNPWTGVGWDNYTQVFGKYDTTAVNHSAEFPFIVHNGFAYVASEYGVPALLLLLWIWLLVLKDTLHLKPAGFTFVQMMAFFLPWAFVGRLIQVPLYVNNPIIGTETWYILGMCLVFQELSRRQERRVSRGLEPEDPEQPLRSHHVPSPYESP